VKTNSKKFICWFCALFLTICVSAQQTGPIERYVIGSAGASDTVRTLTGEPRFFIDWIIGEVVVESFAASRKRLTQGFYQYFLPIPKSTHIFSVLDQDNTIHFTVFPNPFVSDITIKWDFSENLNLLIEVFTLDGRRVFSQRHNAMDSELFIFLSHLNPSLYLLRISDPQRNFSETHKIVKL